jgi:D-3-phosphoglycerate dehydrogenase / 2-oxoglutarate reductase
VTEGVRLTGKTVVIASRSFASTDPEPLALLRRAHLTVVQLETPPRDDALAALLADADGLIIGAIPLTASHFAAAPRLRVVAMHGVGVDHIDLDAASAQGVTVTNAPGSNDASVADLTIALMLACLRRIPEGDRVVREGAWGGTVGEDLTGKTVGILGWGRIGRGVARRLAGFDVKNLFYDPYVAPETIIAAGACPTELDELLGMSDIVTLHLPLTADTRNLLGARRLALLRDSAYLINTARGGIVDEVSLARRLRDGRLRGAGIDCFAVEPPVGNPLLDLPSVVVSPHSGAHTREAITRMGTIAATNVIRVLQGQEPLFPVRPN